MKVDLEVDPEDIVKKKADDRGRVTLGADLADKTVRVAVLEVEEE